MMAHLRTCIERTSSSSPSPSNWLYHIASPAHGIPGALRHSATKTWSLYAGPHHHQNQETRSEKGRCMPCARCISTSKFIETCARSWYTLAQALLHNLTRSYLLPLRFSSASCMWCGTLPLRHGLQLRCMHFIKKRIGSLKHQYMYMHIQISISH